jgi:nucleotide-binding universal stress UspA family protein
MYKNILIPLDCSHVDDVIIEHIIKLCAFMTPEIHLVRALHIHTRDALNYSETVTTDYMGKVSDRFKEINIITDSIIEYGDPEDIIARLAVEKDCDLIAFATHGHKKVMDFLLGSVVEKVRHKTNIPILLIKAG